MGDPILRQACSPVSDPKAPEVRALIGDMTDTMEAYGGAGLAAIQIGVPLRVVVFGFEHNPRYPDAAPVPATVLINPEIDVLDTRKEQAWEGCLSVPGLRGMVPRYSRIRYRGIDPEGNSIDREAEGFHARVVQHECDHLDGVLYPQRIEDFETFGFIEELEASGAFGTSRVGTAQRADR